MAILFATSTLKELEYYGGSNGRSYYPGNLNEGLSEFFGTSTYNNGFSYKFDAPLTEFYLAVDMWGSNTISTGDPKPIKITTPNMGREIIRLQGTSANIGTVFIHTTGNTYAALGTMPVTAGRRRYDCYFKKHATEGRIVIKVNDEIAFDYTGDTVRGNLDWGGLAFGSTGTGGIDYYQIIVADEPTDKLRLVQLNYTTNGDTMDWTGTVADINANSAQSSLINSLDGSSINTTELDKDALFNIAALPAAFTDSKIKAVVVGARAQTETPITSIHGLTKIAGTVYDVVPKKSAQSNLAGYNAVFDVNPATGQAWTPADLVGAQFGYRSKG